MNIYRRILPAVLLLGPVLTFSAPVQAQSSVAASARPAAISVLDSTKDQDGLVGSVRRVKTETARIEIKDGRPVEGAPQLVELTTYGIKGNRIENTSYPIGAALVGKEEYKYDKRGNITEMTLRDDNGAILSREAYSYEFDKFGNWTRMVTSLVVFENGELKREPIEVTYRTVTYYFDDTVAKAVEQPAEPVAEAAPVAAEPIREIRVPDVPSPATNIQQVQVLEVVLRAPSTNSLNDADAPPPIIVKADSAFAARKNKEVESSEPVAAQPEPKSKYRPEVKPEAKPMTVALQPVTSTAQKLANDLYLSGRGQFESGNVRGAVESYLQSIQLEPGSAEVFLNLGHAYLKLEKDGDAIKAFKESVKLNPDVAETYYGLGFANFRTHHFRDAAAAFKKATTLNPAMAKAHYGLALAYQELSDTNGVLAQYRILERLEPSLAKKLAATFPEFSFPCRRGGGC
ncbi:MAG TPA: tetratricopeptide repeat protein [Pyrinomonadaceae bacterium]|nr:tetratricopeptide repeat protein [Pyrinomonadaceae bacterium]